MPPVKPGDSDNGERTDKLTGEPDGPSGNGKADLDTAELGAAEPETAEPPEVQPDDDESDTTEAEPAEAETAEPDESDEGAEPDDAEETDAAGETEPAEAPLLGQAELERAEADKAADKAHAGPKPEAAVRKQPFEKAPPVMPTAREAALHRAGGPTTPRIVRVSMYVWIASAVVAIFAGVFLMLNKQALIEDALKLPNSKLTRAQAEQGVTTLLWMFLVVNVIFAALTVLFSYKSQEGVRRSRLMLTIVCVIMIGFHFVLFATAYGQISALLGVVALVLLYAAPSARQFFAAERTK